MMIRLFFITLLILSTPAFALNDKIYKELETFSRVLDVIDKQYVEEVDEHTLIEGAIQGMLQSLDPHSVYFPPRMYQEFQADTQGRFGGIGIEINVKNGVLTVVAPIEDSPAYRAGIRSGDRILRINGAVTKGVGIMEAVSMMRGHTGKPVVLTIWHEGMPQAKDVSMVREIINVRAVKSDLLEEGIGYARITSFQARTTEELRVALQALEEKGKLEGLILDLRDNPGGLLSEAIGVADLFLEDGLIVSTKGRTEESEIKKAKNNSSYETLPIVVLINQGSASASEIVAGALQDLKRAKILGLNSYGKGSVQTIVELGNKAAVKITIAKYYTPRGRSIDGKGIEPDINLGVSNLAKDYAKIKKEDWPTLQDYQKTKALQYLKKGKN